MHAVYRHPVQPLCVVQSGSIQLSISHTTTAGSSALAGVARPLEGSIDENLAGNHLVQLRMVFLLWIVRAIPADQGGHASMLPTP